MHSHYAFLLDYYTGLIYIRCLDMSTWTTKVDKVRRFYPDDMEYIISTNITDTPVTFDDELAKFLYTVACIINPEGLFAVSITLLTVRSNKKTVKI